MADEFEEMERKEALKHRKNILGAKSRRDIQRENERYEKARIRIGKMHTAQTLGADWRERAAARSRTPEFQAAKAQEALASKAAENRERNRKQLTPLEENVTRRKMELPGGGTAEFGIGTLANMRAYQQKQQEAKEAQRQKVGESIAKMYADAAERNKQRYESELASRGFAPPKTREEENLYNRQRMEDFRLVSSAKERAKQEEADFRREVQLLNRQKIEARRAGSPTAELEVLLREKELSEMVGGNLSNVTNQRRYFEQKAMDETKRQLEERYRQRRERLAKQTSANPEASTSAPEAATPPVEPAVTQPPQPPQPTPPPTPTVKPTTAPTGPKVPTSSEITNETLLPGISGVQVEPKRPDESAADYNARELNEYEAQVILPSLDENSRNALLTARELNAKINQLFSTRFQTKENRDRYRELQSSVKEQRKILKDKIKELRTEGRGKAFSGDEAAKRLNRYQIATLQKELGTLEKYLF